MTAKKIDNTEEIFFDTFKVIWSGKWLIIFLTVLSFLISFLYIKTSKEIFESRIFYDVYLTDLSVDSKVSLRSPYANFEDQFRNEFYRQSLFDAWLTRQDNKSLNYEDLSLFFTNSDGYEFQKRQENMEGFFNNTEVKNENKQRALIVKTNDKNKLRAYYLYMQFINEHITDKQKKLLQMDLETIKRIDEYANYLNYINDYLTNTYSSNETLTESDKGNIIKIYRDLLKGRPENLNKSEINIHIKAIQEKINVLNSDNIFYISKPTIPLKISPKSLLISISSVLFGFFLGILILLVRNFLILGSKKS